MSTYTRCSGDYQMIKVSPLKGEDDYLYLHRNVLACITHHDLFRLDLKADAESQSNAAQTAWEKASDNAKCSVILMLSEKKTGASLKHV
eukprot:IDg16332t1